MDTRSELSSIFPQFHFLSKFNVYIALYEGHCDIVDIETREILVTGENIEELLPKAKEYLLGLATAKIHSLQDKLYDYEQGPQELSIPQLYFDDDKNYGLTLHCAKQIAEAIVKEESVSLEPRDPHYRNLRSIKTIRESFANPKE